MTSVFPTSSRKSPSIADAFQFDTQPAAASSSESWLGFSTKADDDDGIDATTTTTTTSASLWDTSMFTTKTWAIVFLSLLLVLSILGINLFHIANRFVEIVKVIFGPFVVSIFSFFGYTTASVVGKGISVVGDTAQTGIEVAEGTVESVGDVLKDAAAPGMHPASAKRLDEILNQSPNQYKWYSAQGQLPPVRDWAADSASSVIQQSGASRGAAGKACLIAEEKTAQGSQRTCTTVSDESKCLSGQVFPSIAACTKPSPPPASA